jgi:hypothetical protein
MNVGVRIVAHSICVITMLTALSGCDTAPKSTNAKAGVVILRRLPVSMKVRQRSTTRVPGSQQSLHLTIDDITRGQVMATLKDSNGKTVLASTSFSAGDVADFSLGDENYQLQLTELDNSLTSDDYASFVIAIPSESAGLAEPGKPADSGQETIEKLLRAVEGSEGVVFIRNSEEYSAKEAADHLRMKWKSAGGDITTAEEFIDQIATKSSISNEPYRVRKPDGTEVESSAYLHEKLREINAKR